MQQIEYVSLVFTVPLEYEETLQGYFLTRHAPQGFEERADGAFIVHLLKKEWSFEAEKNLAAFLHSLVTANVTLDETITQQNTDWNAEWESSIEPIRITDDLVIAPSWKLQEARALHSNHLLIIDPKMSFGTGHHETTRLCLKKTERIDCTGKTILDLGSGTGILAMYAMMRGAKHAVAIDTDEWAFENAKENCTRNNFSLDEIDVRHGDLASAVNADEKFDIIFANIHRNVLLAISSEIASHQEDGDTLILSGLLEYDADEVIAAYESCSYHLVDRMQENEWVALRFEFTK
ncbi:MAG TPA: 50S ribosomal protein L11 methyltransferase [Candidatus Kapabacteria bacterium]|nr:50S ribosomal protein L11 methyltransferase [Candidatus Kapabacteria bacterium]